MVYRPLGLTSAVPVIDTAGSPGLTWPVHVILDAPNPLVPAELSVGNAYTSVLATMTWTWKRNH